MSDTPKPETADRLAKVMARAGLCSRRDAEGWIAAGRVMVNGKKVITPAFNVTSRDKITVDGQPLAERQGTRIWLYHKPAGLVVTEKDPEGRPTIFEALEEQGLPRVVTVGRLDINTEGLLLLTNDGGLKRVLELPSTGWLRRYRVRAYGFVTQAQLDGLKDGITVDGVNYGPIEATLEREQGHNVWIVVGLREGKNREVKNVLGALGLEVNRLIRVSYGPFQLGDLAEGQIEVVKAKMLKDQLGKKLAEAAGVDFDSEMPEGLFPPPRAMSESPRGRGPRSGGGRFDARGGEDRRSFRDDDRPVRPRRIHFDDDGRAPEEYEPKGPGKPRFDKDDQPARSFGRPAERPARSDRPERSDRKSFGDKKPFGEKRGHGDKKPFGDRKPYGDKSFGDRPQRGRRPDGDDRPARSFGDRPRRDDDRRGGGDRPQRGFGDKPARNFGDRPDRGDRPARSFGDKPGRSFGDRPDRGDRPARSFGDKPGRSFGERPARGDRPARPFGDKPGRSFGDRPDRGDRPSRPFGDKPARGPRSDRPQRGFEEGRPPRRDDRPGQGRPQGSRPAGKSFGDKPRGARPEGGRPTGGSPAGGKPFGGKPSGGRPTGPRKPRG